MPVILCTTDGRLPFDLLMPRLSDPALFHAPLSAAFQDAVMYRQAEGMIGITCPKCYGTPSQVCRC